ncbi:MAG: hypothetical protein ACFE85_09405 [Candidatus Hodarchaeota archaeon]
MSNTLNERINVVNEYFKDFNNFIELKDFRAFLLFTLTSQVPMNIMAQLGLGGDREKINVPYNPEYKIYYQKVNLISSGSLTIYVKSEPITEKFHLEKDNEIFRTFLNPNEISLAFRGREKFLFPKIGDCSALYDEKLKIIIDDLFFDLKSFISFSQPNVLFVLDSNTDVKPDLIFTFNMMPQLPSKSDENILKVDVYLDYEHKTKNITYIKREEDYTLKYLNDIKEVSHADLYKSTFSLVLHIKSLNKPF